MRFFLALTLGALIPLSVGAQESPPRPMTTDDGLQMIQVGSPIISPDGSWVLYSRSELDWDENERKTTWWRVDVDGGAHYRFIGEGGGSSFAFAPDGSALAFTRRVDDEAQLFHLPADGGEAKKLSDHESSVRSFRWLADGSAIVFLADEPRSEEAEKRHDDGEDAIFVDEGANGQGEGAWSNLWWIDVASGEERRLTEVDHRVGAFDVSPDGSRVVFTARSENRRNQGDRSEIFLLDVASGAIEQLTDNQAPEGRPLWAPDGRRFAYEAPSADSWELRLDKIWVMDVETRSTRMVSGEVQGNIGSMAWTPDGEGLLFGVQQRTDRNLLALDIESGEVTRRTDAVGSLNPTSFSADRSWVAYTFDDFDSPRDVWVGPSDGSTRMRLTELNPWVERDLALARAEVVRWESADGTEIEGILALPSGYDGGQLPLLLHIHGGPAGSFSNSFNSRAHVWAGLGYAQLMPNVRGSSAYTDELLRGNMADIGGGDFEDLMTGVDFVIDRGIAHPDSLGVRGWSYGGILGGWTVTQTDRFKAASLGAMVSDWTSEYGPGFNYDVRLWYIGGTPWENADEWRRRSALTHVANVTTPTLLLHGVNDRTDTEAQSMMFFQALKDQGKEARYIRFPREPHGFREPRHQRTRDVEEIRWIQQYLRGIEWTPWDRVEKDTEEEKVISQ